MILFLFEGNSIPTLEIQIQGQMLYKDGREKYLQY